MNLVAAVLGILERINRVSLFLCRYATMGLVAGIAVVIAASVFWRYALNDALSWSEELAKYLMIWMVFVGAPIALRQGAHVAIELLPQALPERAKQLLFALVFLIVAALMVMFVYRGLTFAWNGRTQIMITVGGYSMFWLFVSIPLGSLIMLFVAAELSLRRLARAIWPARFDLPDDALHPELIRE